jgi:hypothetical protein
MADVPSLGSTKTAPSGETLDLIALSQSLLDDLRQGGSGEVGMARLAALPALQLQSALIADGPKMAFWINVYNACNLYWLRRIPMDDFAAKKRHFFERRIVVGGQRLSLNMIEHGLLRRSKLWWARGYLGNPLAGHWEKAMRVSMADPRVHFALNCGANGCPLIRFYSAQGIETELEHATSVFMMTEVIWAAEEMPSCVQVSSIFSMYQGDFGGRAGILEWVRRYRPDLPNAKLKILFMPYDWTVNLDRFE